MKQAKMNLGQAAWQWVANKAPYWAVWVFIASLIATVVLLLTWREMKQSKMNFRQAAWQVWVANKAPHWAAALFIASVTATVVLLLTMKEPANPVLASITLGLTGITTIYVYETWKIAQGTRQQREDAVHPLIVFRGLRLNGLGTGWDPVSPENCLAQGQTLHVQNIGAAAALNVSVKFANPNEQSIGTPLSVGPLGVKDNHDLKSMFDAMVRQEEKTNVKLLMADYEDFLHRKHRDTLEISWMVAPLRNDSRFTSTDKQAHQCLGLIIHDP